MRKEVMGKPRPREGEVHVQVLTAHMGVCWDWNPHLLGFHIAFHRNPGPREVGPLAAAEAEPLK